MCLCKPTVCYIARLAEEHRVNHAAVLRSISTLTEGMCLCLLQLDELNSNFSSLELALEQFSMLQQQENLCSSNVMIIDQEKRRLPCSK
jgi:hypothetical protein